jgi:hypothetical protein
MTSFFWRNVTGDGSLSFVVVQIGSKLYFYNTATGAAALSIGLESGTVDLTGFSPSGAPDPSTRECQFADGFGKLFVVHPLLEAFSVSYNTSDDTFSTVQIDIKVRDFEGDSADTNALTDRPSSLDDTHKYNLYNQGWTDDALTKWDTARTDWPSNVDVWWTYKNSTDVFDATNIDKIDRGNTPAPKGHFILDLYNQDRNTASGLTGCTDKSTGYQRASAVTFFAGRVFYTGVNYAGFNTKIYFTQIIERDDQFGQCYQANDPTNEDLFDLSPADGGVISIPEAGTIYKLFPMQNALVVFASKGVWTITGSTGLGFSSNDYTVIKISNYRTISASSFVEVNGAPIWWNSDGIFTVQGQANGLQGLAATSLSFTTIQTFFNSIPAANKEYVRGFYNQQSQIVQWLFRQAAATTASENYEFDSILVFNSLTGAFYTWQISGSDWTVNSIVSLDTFAISVTPEVVVDNDGVTVTSADGSDVTSYGFPDPSAAPVETVFKYLVSKPDSGSYLVTWAHEDDTSLYDWSSADGPTDYTSYFLTGYKTHDDAIKDFQTMYIVVFNEGLGQAVLRGVWDYAGAGNTYRMSKPQTLNFNDPNYTINKLRRKLRGQGSTVQYLLSSTTGQPFSLIGWSAFETGNTAP